MNSYAARSVYPCTVPYNIKLYTVLHVTFADYTLHATEGARVAIAGTRLLVGGRSTHARGWLRGVLSSIVDRSEEQGWSKNEQCRQRCGWSRCC